MNTTFKNILLMFAFVSLTLASCEKMESLHECDDDKNEHVEDEANEQPQATQLMIQGNQGGGSDSDTDITDPDHDEDHDKENTTSTKEL